MTLFVFFIALSIILGVCFIVAAIAFVIAMTFVTRYARMALSWEENIGDSLDMLDESYQKISYVLQKPLFRDTPEIRAVLLEIAYARDAVLLIANALTLPAQSRVIPDTAKLEFNLQRNE